MSQHADSMKSELVSLMAQIDAFDSDLADLLGRRFQRSRRIGYIKKSLGMPRSDPARIADQIEHFIGQATARGVDGKLAESLIRAIIDRVIAERLSGAICNGRAQS